MCRWISIRMFILCTTLGLLLGGMGINIAAAQDAAPYIYYYHRDLNAWVIERADGTDSRLLAQGMTDPNMNVADGYWSHTGEWFAWRNNFYGGGAGGDFKLHFVSTDGTRTSGITDQFHDANSIQWAAKSDYIFLSAFKDNRENYALYLVDVPNEKIIWSQRTEGRLVGDYFVYWEYGGQDRTLLKDSVKILSLSSGEVLDMPKDDSSRAAYQRFVDPSLLSQPYLKIEVGTQGGLLILDVAKGELFEIDSKGMPLTPYSGDYFQWSADGQYALAALGNKICPNTTSTECVDLWLMSPKQRSVQHITDDVVGTMGIVGAESSMLWSAKEPIAVFVGQDGSIFTLDARTGLVKSIAGVKASLPFRWVKSGNTLFFLSDNDKGLLYKVSLDEAAKPVAVNLPLDRSTFYYLARENFYISPDGRYVGLSNSQILYDFERDIFTPLVRHSAAAYASTFNTYYDWTPDSDWLLTGQTISYASGGGGPYASMVLHSDGSERRELNILYSPVQWLPPQVVAHLPSAQTKSPLPQPYLTLEHPGNATAAAWNTKGDRLAVAVDDAQLYIWSFEEPEPKVEQIIKIGGVCGFGVFDCDITWSPDDRFISLGVIPKPDYQQTYFSLIDVKNGSVIGDSDYPFEWNDKGFSISKLNYPASKDDTPTLSAEYLGRGEAKGVVDIREKTEQKFVVEFPIDGKFTSLKWLVDGKHFLVQTDCSLQEWDVQEGLIGTFKPFDFCVPNYVVSSDAHWVSTESIYAPTKVSYFGSDQPSVGLNWYAKSVSFTPDNCWLTASGTQLVTIWKLSDLIPDGANKTDNCRSLVKGTYKVKPS